MVHKEGGVRRRREEDVVIKRDVFKVVKVPLISVGVCFSIALNSLIFLADVYGGEN